MLTPFWITNTRYQNVGGKHRQFETLADLVAYALKAKLMERDDAFSVHSLADDVPVEWHTVQAVFAAGGNPSTLAQTREFAGRLQQPINRLDLHQTKRVDLPALQDQAHLTPCCAQADKTTKFSNNNYE